MRVRVMIARPIPRDVFEDLKSALKKEQGHIQHSDVNDMDCCKSKQSCKDEQDALKAQILLKDAEIADLREQIAKLKTRLQETVGSYEEALSQHEARYRLAREVCETIKKYSAAFEEES